MIDLLNGIAQPWWAWMGSMLWQVSLLVLIVTGLDFLLRRWAWPQVRYALWILVLVKLILPPSWTLPSSLFSGWTPLAKMRIEERLATPFRTSTAGDILRKPPTIPAYTATPESPDVPSELQAAQPGTISESVPPGPKLTWKAIAFLVWIVGMGIFMILLSLRISGLRRWHRQQLDKKSIPVWYYELLVKTTKRLKLARLPAIVFSKDAKAPAIYGLFRPVLLLPASYLDSLSPEDAEHVLLHELAHLKRGDLWLHGLCLLLQIVYWFNPLLIWTRRQMKHVREICCDLTIANVLKEKTMKYRETLLNTARELLTETAEPGMGLLGVFEDPFRLVARLRWLEKRSWQKRKLMAAAVVLVTVIMTAAVLPMGTPGREFGSAVSRQEAKDKEAEKALIENLRLDVEIKTIPPLYAAVLRRIGGLDESAAALVRLKQLLDEARIEPTGYPFGRYISDSDDVPLEEFVWEIGYPIPPGTKVEPPLEIIQVSELQVASATIEGIEFTEEVWPKFVRAVSDFGFVPSGLPVFEIWKGESEGQKFWWKTEMLIMAFDIDEGYPGMEISFKETEPFTAFVLPMQGSYTQLAEGAKLLKRIVAEKRIRTTGPPFGRYFTDGSKVLPSQYVWEIGYPVEEGTTADPPFVIRRIEEAKVASTTLPGPPEPDYPWGPFILQILIEGYVPALPAIEIWHGDPQKSGSEGPRMELQIPVIPSGDIGRNDQEAPGGPSSDTPEEKSAPSEPTRISTAGKTTSKTLFSEAYNFSFGKKNSESFQAVTLLVTGPPEDLFPEMRKLQDWMQLSGTKPAMEVTYVEITEGFDEDELNQQWAQWLLERQYRIAEGALVFCPDKLYDSGCRTPHWEIRAKILKVKGDLPETEIYTQWSNPQIAAILPMKGSHGQEPKALARLEAYLREIDVSPSGRPFFRYFNDAEIFPEDELLWEVGIPVPKGVAVKAPYEIKNMREGLEAFTEFECSKEDLLKYCYAYAAKLQCLGFFGIGYPKIILKSGEVHGRAVREIRIPVRKMQLNPSQLPAFF